jgi:hypothetical protein
MAETTLPAAGYLEDLARSEGEMATAFEDLRQVIAETAGTIAETELTIATGVITPTGAVHSVDTEADAATDVLDNILTTNMADGRLIILRSEDNARVTTITHQATGAGQVHAADSNDIVLDNTTQFVALQRRGADWYEVFRTKPPITLPGYIGGVILSNNAVTPTTKLDISAGAASDSTGSKLLVQDTALTKLINNNTWAAGNDAAGVLAGDYTTDFGWWNVFYIEKDSDGSIDVGFEQAATPTLPSGYTKWGLVGSLLWEDLATDSIRGFSHVRVGGISRYMWDSPIRDLNGTANLAHSLETLTVPTGRPVIAHTNIYSTSDGKGLYISTPAQDDEAPSTSVAPLATLGEVGGVSDNGRGSGPSDFLTDASGRVDTVSTADGNTLVIVTLGWTDI